MEKQERAESPLSVKPTGQQPSENYSDIAMTSLFNACVAVVNSERQTVWQRYTAMLMANTVVFGFLGVKAPDAPIVVVLGCALGIVLCFLWRFLTSDGWKFLDIYSQLAAKFSWPRIDEGTNPIKLMYDEFGKAKGDRIKTAALWVINVFIVGYILLAVWTVVPKG